MKKVITLIAVALAVGTLSSSAQIKLGGKKLDTGKILQAASDVATAVTLTDAQIAELCRESIEWMDANNPIAPDDSEYAQRLKRLTDGVTNVNGMPLNFKVYLVTDINAFASGDGSVRVFSALMDVMDDDQLAGIIGHEIGHVANTDIKDAVKNAYLASAGKNLASSAGGKLAKLTDSELAQFVSALTDAQFSQKQEYAADDYGYNFCVQRGRSPYGMASSLEKLVELFESGGQQASVVQKMFSTHPDSANRAKRVRAKADEYMKTK